MSRKSKMKCPSRSVDARPSPLQVALIGCSRASCPGSGLSSDVDAARLSAGVEVDLDASLSSSRMASLEAREGGDRFGYDHGEAIGFADATGRAEEGALEEGEDEDEGVPFGSTMVVSVDAASVRVWASWSSIRWAGARWCSTSNSWTMVSRRVKSIGFDTTALAPLSRS